MTLREKFQRGVALLDEKLPLWYKHVDLDQLKMRDCAQCILGQCLGGFFAGCDKLGISHPEALNYGLDCYFSIEHGLTEMWKNEIKARLKRTKRRKSGGCEIPQNQGEVNRNGWKCIFHHGTSDELSP